MSHSKSRALLFLSFIAFVSLGLPDGLIGVAWPSMRASFDLPLDALGALFTSTTIGYVATSFLSGALLRRIRLGDLLALSCLATACALITYAVTPSWWVLVGLGVLAGAGGGAIDSALNTFAANNYSPRTINMLHAFYGLGTTLGPALMTTILLAGERWQRGYLIVGIAQSALALGFLLTRRSWPEVGDAATVHPMSASLFHTIRLPAMALSAAIFVLYCGLEASTGAWLFTLLHEGRDVDTGTAGTAVSVYWGSLMAARVVFGLIHVKGQLAHWLSACMIVCVTATLALSFSPHAAIAIGAAVLLGFFCGPIFPWLISETPKRLGVSHGANAIGIQIASAAIGLAIAPTMTGIAGDSIGLHAIPWVLFGLAITLLAAFLTLERVASSVQPSPISE